MTGDAADRDPTGLEGDGFDGDGQGLDALRTRAVAVAYRMLGSRSEAEDIAQETLERVRRAVRDGGESIRNRAAFLLHDAFGYGYDELAVILDRSPAACRKLVSRARQRLAERRRR